MDGELVRRRGAGTRRLSLLAGILSLALALSGCHRRAADAGEFELRHTITPMPVRVGHSRLNLDLLPPDAASLAGAQIQVELDMAHPGMAPRFSDAKEDSPGHYSADLNLDMAGDWIVLLHLRLADGRQAERQFALHGVQP